MKKILVIIIAVAAVVIIGAGSVFAAGQVAKSSAIGEEAAENFAFVDAGISPEKVENVRTDFEFEKGKFVYEVEFIANGISYEYAIDTKSGAIVSKEMEEVDGNRELDDARNSQESEQLAELIARYEEEALREFAEQESMEEEYRRAMEQRAEEEALKESAEQESMEEEYRRLMEEEARRAEEEAAQRAKEAEEAARRAAEEELAARLEAETNAISVEEAKAIALRHAGLSADDVVFSKAMLDWENGRRVYEVEFDQPGIAEYEYDIDLLTGEIVSADMDAWEIDRDSEDD